MSRPSWRVRAAMAALGVALVAAGADAQFRGRFAPRLATAADYDGSFHFCRGWFRSGFGGDGGGWAADYPWADINLSIRLGEMTKTIVSKDSVGDPKPLIMRLSDPTIFQCGFVMMTEVGAIVIDEAEAKNLRNYLLKGGFLWVDDFWGRTRGTTGPDRFARCFRPASTRLKICRPSTRCSTCSSGWRGRRRLRTSGSGSAPGRHQNAAATARWSTPARSAIATGA